MGARYLNVDLIVQSNTDLTLLVDFFEGKVFFLWNDLTGLKNSFGIETKLCDTSEPSEDIIELLNLIELLPEDLKKLWLNIEKKIIDIGYECGTMEDPINSLLNPNIVNRLAQLGFAINIRIYPATGPVDTYREIVTNLIKK